MTQEQFKYWKKKKGWLSTQSDLREIVRQVRSKYEHAYTRCDLEEAVQFLEVELTIQKYEWRKKMIYLQENLNK